MQKLKVKGKNILSGEIKISGSKNATVPILAASILSEKKIDVPLDVFPKKFSRTRNPKDKALYTCWVSKEF